MVGTYIKEKYELIVILDLRIEGVQIQDLVFPIGQKSHKATIGLSMRVDQDFGSEFSYLPESEEMCVMLELSHKYSCATVERVIKSRLESYVDNNKPARYYNSYLNTTNK